MSTCEFCGVPCAEAPATEPRTTSPAKALARSLTCILPAEETNRSIIGTAPYPVQSPGTFRRARCRRSESGDGAVVPRNEEGFSSLLVRRVGRAGLASLQDRIAQI